MADVRCWLEFGNLEALGKGPVFRDAENVPGLGRFPGLSEEEPRSAVFSGGCCLERNKASMELLERGSGEGSLGLCLLGGMVGDLELRRHDLRFYFCL